MAIPDEILRDAYATEDEKRAAAQMIALQNQAHQGALFDDWMRHQAGRMFERYLNEQVADAKNKWLSAADREAAEVVRIQAQVFQKVKQWISAQIAGGKVAALGIKKFEEEGTKLEGWITDQSPK